MRQLDVKPGRGAALTSRRGRNAVSALSRALLKVPSIALTGELSTVLLVGVSLRNRLGLIGGGGVAQEAGLHFVGIGEAPVPNVERRGPPNNEILPSGRESIGIQSAGLPDQGSGHGVALLAVTSTLKIASAPQARANATLCASSA
jgi:hypothetical protein